MEDRKEGQLDISFLITFQLRDGLHVRVLGDHVGCGDAMVQKKTSTEDSKREGEECRTGTAREQARDSGEASSRPRYNK